MKVPEETKSTIVTLLILLPFQPTPNNLNAFLSAPVHLPPWHIIALQFVYRAYVIIVSGLKGTTSPWSNKDVITFEYTRVFVLLDR